MKELSINKITAALGQPADHEAVQELLVQFGNHMIPKTRPEDPYADLALKKSGIEFNFADEDYLNSRDVAEYGRAPSILYAVTLYAKNGEPGFTPYEGELPGGGYIGDTLEAQVARLGPPTETIEDDGDLLSRSWCLGEYWLSFAYHLNGSLRFASLITDRYMKLLNAQAS